MTSRTPGPRELEEKPPSALKNFQDISSRIDGKKLALFLDYDGTLTPIVDDPERAVLNEPVRNLLISLSGLLPVAVISGRDLSDVGKRVGIPSLYYAGSHGFDIAGPGGRLEAYQGSSAALSALDKAEKELSKGVASVPGAWVDRKRFSIAVHFRKVKEEDVESVRQVVKAVAAQFPDLRQTEGKKVFELLPDIDWHKGKAVIYLLRRIGLDGPEVVPVYIGDDMTDEDAFDALGGRGIGIVVMDSPRPTKARYRLKDPGEVAQFLKKIMSIHGELHDIDPGVC